jgi:DNA-binding MarR family transcriptional regulator
MNNNNDSTTFLFGNTMRQFGKLIKKKFAEENMPITTEQFGILDMIAKKDEFIQSDLATLLDKDKSGIMRHIDSLETNRLVVRMNDPEDRRKKFLVLTKIGDDVRLKAISIVQGIMTELLNGVEEKDLDAFRRVLILLKTNADHKLSPIS